MIHGILPALLTPMSASGDAVDHAVLRRLVEFHIQSGVSGFFVCGGTGEGLLLLEQERRAVLETVVDAASGRARIIAHVGALDTGTAERLAAHAAGLEVDAVAAVPPVYFRVDDDAICDHYRLIAEAASGKPVFVYNIPSATGVEINARLMRRLIAIPAVRGALLDKKVVGAQAVEALAKLPTRKELLGQVLGTIIAPLSNAAGLFESLLTAVPGLTQALHDKMDEKKT